MIVLDLSLVLVSILVSIQGSIFSGRIPPPGVKPLATST